MKKKIAVLAIVMLQLASCHKETSAEISKPVPGDNFKTAYGKMCYRKVTEAKALLEGNVAIRDTMIFTVERQGDNVSGVFNWLPQEKDKKTGTFKGTMKDNVGTVIYTYNAEGTEQKEELVFKIDEKEVAIKYGEMEEVNGIWKLKNMEKADYTEALPRVDCK